MKYAKRRDQNHAEIVEELRKCGICCEDLSSSGGGVTDIVTHYADRTVFIEIKFGKDAVLKKTQIKFLSRWAGHCGIAKTIEEAQRLAINPWGYALLDSQKDKLAIYYRTMTAKEVRLATIEKLLKASEGV